MMHRFFRRLREWFRPTGYFIIVPEGSTLILQGSPKIDTIMVRGLVTFADAGPLPTERPDNPIPDTTTMAGCNVTWSPHNTTFTPSVGPARPRRPKRKAKAKRKTP